MERKKQSQRYGFVRLKIDVFEQWRSMKLELSLDTDSEMAAYLLRSHREKDDQNTGQQASTSSRARENLDTGLTQQTSGDEEMGTDEETEREFIVLYKNPAVQYSPSQLMPPPAQPLKPLMASTPVVERHVHEQRPEQVPRSRVQLFTAASSQKSQHDEVQQGMEESILEVLPTDLHGVEDLAAASAQQSKHDEVEQDMTSGVLPTGSHDIDDSEATSPQQKAMLDLNTSTVDDVQCAPESGNPNLELSIVSIVEGEQTVVPPQQEPARPEETEDEEEEEEDAATEVNQPPPPDTFDADFSTHSRLLHLGYERDIVTAAGVSTSARSLAEEEYILVSASSLQQLVQSTTFSQHCTTCSAKIKDVKESRVGCARIYSFVCEKGHVKLWTTSSQCSGMYAANLHFAAAVLNTGNSFAKIAMFCKGMHIGAISSSTFYRLQHDYLIPAIDRFYNSAQQTIFTSLGASPVCIAGDGRMDSPGYSAQYCTYSGMDMHRGYILHMEVVDKRQVQLKSPVMEVLGCRLLLEFLMGKLNVTELITDAHPSIGAMMKEEQFRAILHQLDIWHKSSKIGSKLRDAASGKRCEPLYEWIAPIKNHFWHCCKSCNGDEVILKDSWINVLRHVQGYHEWMDGQCSHSAIDDSDKTPLPPDSPAVHALREIVMDRKLLSSLHYYRMFRHTGLLENFHQVILAYAPKRSSYQFPAMCARMKLAAIDHNHHLHRRPKVGKNGLTQYKKMFGKKAQRWSCVYVKEDKSYSYLDSMNTLVFHMRETSSEPLNRRHILAHNDPRLIARTIHPLPPPETRQLADQRKSRFGEEQQ